LSVFFDVCLFRYVEFAFVVGLDKFRSIFVGNLPDDAHEAAVEQLFSKFGAVLDVAVKQGYGFVDFASPEDAQSVLDALARGEQLYLDGRKLNIEPRKREPPEFTRVNRAAKLKKIAKQQQQQQQPQQQKQQSEQQQQKQQQQQQQKQQQQPEQPQPQQPSQQQQQQQQKQKQQQQQQPEQPQSTPQP
jgi:RNA recognition motif-containing protein